MSQPVRPTIRKNALIASGAAFVFAAGACLWALHANETKVIAADAQSASANRSAHVVQLSNSEAIGKRLIAGAERVADGKPIDGIGCAAMENEGYHAHAHLALFYRGAQVQVPGLIGAVPTTSGGCFYWIHTHDMSGIVHVEAPASAPAASFTLGALFDVWGRPLARDGVAGLRGPVVAFVNGTRYEGDLRAIPLEPHQQIVLEVGTPLAAPPAYAFPGGE